MFSQIRRLAAWISGVESWHPRSDEGEELEEPFASLLYTALIFACDHVENVSNGRAIRKLDLLSSYQRFNFCALEVLEIAIFDDVLKSLILFYGLLKICLLFLGGVFLSFNESFGLFLGHP